MTDNRWAEILRQRSQRRRFDTDARQQRRELLLIVAKFAHRYKKLLETAVVELSKEVGEACWRAGVSSTATDAEIVWRYACEFVDRFTVGDYESPWGGFFTLRPSATVAPTLRDDDELGEEIVTGDFQQVSALVRLFNGAETAERNVLISASSEALTDAQFDEVSTMASDHVRREYATCLSGWETASAYRAKNQFAIVKAPPAKKFTDATLEQKKQQAPMSSSEEIESTNAAAGPFTHSPDYRSVAVRGSTYTLTPRQAQMIQILHTAHENRTPDVGIDSILTALETPNARWQDTFKSNPETQKALVRSGGRKGTLRLNL